MGKFGDAFKREVGKNTGKFVSNLVFGDKHSTPYRRVGNTDVQRARAEAQQIKANAESEHLHAQIAKQKQDDLNILDSAVLKNVDIVLQTPIPQDEAGLVNLMSIWAAQLSGCKWDYQSDEGIIRNQFPDALMEKFTQCSIVLKSVAPANAMLEYFNTIMAEAKKRQHTAEFGESNKHEVGRNRGSFVLGPLLGNKRSTSFRRVNSDETQQSRAEARPIESNIEGDSMLAQTATQGHNDLNNHYDTLLKDVNIVLQTPIPQDESSLVNLMSVWASQLFGSEWDFQDNESKYRNQFLDALMEKLTQCSIMLKSVSPTNAMISYYDNVLTEAAKRRHNAKTERGRKKTWKCVKRILFLIMIFFLIYIILLYFYVNG